MKGDESLDLHVYQTTLLEYLEDLGGLLGPEQSQKYAKAKTNLW